MKKYNIKSLALVLILFAISMNNFLISGDNRDKGFGPVKSLQLGAINKGQVSIGQSIFNSKCFVCHALDNKKVGPPLRNVSKEQTPEYIMNLLLNTAEMQQKDGRLKQLIAQFKVPMPPPNLSKEDARSVLEYLRSASGEK